MTISVQTILSGNLKGFTGSAGPADGYTGSQGYTGSRGPAGGYTGSKGNTGNTGYTGSAGGVTTGKAIAMALVFGG